MKKSRLLGTSMFLHTLLFLLVLLPVSQVQAAAVITLTATTPENAWGGYLPGTIVDFDATITQDTASAIQVRLAQLDFAASDSMLTFLGDFNFDFSTLVAGDALYATFPSYPPPATVYTGGARIDFGFVTPTTWSAPNGLITGSPLALTAVPIPPALWLFGSGLLGLIVIARKKK
jgi:hypothetical protein